MTSFEAILPIVAFAFAGFATPGPNNIIIATSSVNFGFRKAMPVILGVVLGFHVMALLAVLGLGNLMLAHPAIHATFRYLSFAVMLYLAYKLATAGISERKAGAAPPTFAGMVAFQWVNPKAWALAALAVSFLDNESELLLQSILVLLIFLGISLLCQLLWGYAGSWLGGFLRASGLRLRIFNVTMAILMIGSFVPVLVK